MRGTGFLALILIAGCSRDNSATSSLHLTAGRRGDVIELRWKPDPGIAARMQKGELRIADAGRREVVPLDTTALAYGSVAYMPQSSDVQVDFEVELEGSRRARESVRMLDAKSAQTDGPPPSPAPSPASAAPVEGFADRSQPAGTPAGVPDFRLPPRDPRQIAAPPSNSARKAARPGYRGRRYSNRKH
jgi:hypothetical protein